MTTTIFRAGRVVTMGDDAPEAFAASGERVVATGTVGELRGRFHDAEVVDFGSATIVPGFNDAHAHLAIAAEDMLHLDLSMDAVGSLAEIAAVLREQAKHTPAGGWIRGSRYDDAKMPEGRLLTRWDLDEISREHPILILQVAGHWGVVNSKALELCGIDESTEEPFGGKFGRDGNGRLNGLLFEQAIFDFAYPQATKRAQTIAPASTAEDRQRGLRRAMDAFHAAGITSVTDAMVGPADIALFQEAQKRGALTMRINMLLHYEHYGLLAKLAVRTGSGTDRLRLGGIKGFVDGAIGGRTCLLEQPFEGTSDDYGMQTTSDADLRDIVRMVHLDGNRVCVHANGDRAIGKLLDQLEAAQREKARPHLHHRIEHCSVVNEDILGRMKTVGAIAVPFGSYVHYHGAKLLEWYGAKRLERMFAHRAFLDAGVAVAGSSDYPCGPYQPLLALQSCVTRTGFDGAPLGLSQRVTPAEALALYTVNAAYASDEHDVKGRLAPGYVADFVVLDGDPLTADPATLGSLGVVATYVGGENVWQRAA
ncbi:MAG: putative amidohydrolase ytcJ [Candidatus Eremiobacteraeota bacterium]|nr:putative amidohydrolase ytcJ [Candidatus Eremiobacteraeota bacterium]